MSDTKPLVLSDPRMIAEFVKRSEFQGLFEKRFAVPPDLVALLFRNGEFVDAYKGGHFSVNGVVDKLKSLVGGTTHVGMLIADLKPFPVSFGFTALSRDKVEIAGAAHIELQVDPDRPSNILGFMHGVTRVPQGPGPDGKLPEQPGRLSLSKDDIVARLRPHLDERVFAQAIARMDAADLRGNVGLQDKIQADTMLAVQEFAARMGMVVLGASVQWARNPAEQEAMRRAEAEREADAAEFAIGLAKRRIAALADMEGASRDHQLEMFREQTAADTEIKRLALEAEVAAIDLREAQARRQEMEALAHEVAVLKAERVAKFEDEIRQLDHGEERLKAEIRLRKLKGEIEEFEFAAGLRRNALIADESLRQQIQTDKHKLWVAAQNAAQQTSAIGSLAEIERQAEAARTANRNAEKMADAEAFAARARAVEKLDRDQIMGLGAMLSPDVAAVLAQEAQARSGSQAEMMAQMKEMVAAAQAANVTNSQQALQMFHLAMDGAARVAAGAGGKGDPGPGGTVSATPAQAASIDCPKCRTKNSALNNFCDQCGHKLRT
jgi:hypothetical protein